MTGLIAEICFWTASGLLVYAYVVFPAMVLAAARIVRERPVTTSRRSRPSVAVVIAAFNEAKHIADRIRNVLDQEYPADRLSVVIGSDGSTDGTVATAAGAADERVAVRSWPRNRGKASVLNDLVSESRQEVIVFSDANTVFEKDAIKHLVSRFADPQIGTVCGELILTPPDKSQNEDHRYWSLERKLKSAESAIDGLLGANGGVYAIRRSLYTALPADTICDDFVIVMNIASTGQRVVYEPRARAHEESPLDMKAEFRRRVRIGTGNYQALFRNPAFITSTNGVRRWTYVSHKVLRWLTPHLLATLLVASCVLAPQQPYTLLLAAQIAVYATAWLVYATRQVVEWPGLLRSVSLFFVVNLAFALAFFLFLRGGSSGGWQPTER